MDRLIKFCLPKDIQVWLDQYKAPKYESAFAKDIPNSLENQQMAKRLAKVVKIRKKYRGSSLFIEEGRVNVYKRPSSFCHRQFADRFAIYER
tara:strand:- start:600 stop:875 length:276 start_codon:yes stop_codon:yes gene_type:complete